MDLVFDISQDELPIFLAETDDHLQILDEGLVKLEREEDDPELLQLMFRAAHTLKGSAGMIGHKRLVEVTHALETAFDGVRKHTLEISTPLVDVCLEAVDQLRELRNEVVSGKASPIDVTAVVERFNDFIRSGQPPVTPTYTAPVSVPATPAPEEKPSTPLAPAESGIADILYIHAIIASSSVASAARAFQLMLAMQDLGEIVSLSPTQEVIETAAPVSQLRASLKTTKTPEEIRKSLDMIADIDKLLIAGEESAVAAKQGAAPEVEVNIQDLEDVPRLGEYLISKGYITTSQLEKALQHKKDHPDEKIMLGQILVRTRVVTQEKLQQYIAELIQQQRTTIQALQQAAPEKAKERVVDKTVRTSVERLDALMNLVGELITDRNRLYKIRSILEMEQRGNEQVMSLTETIAHIGRITDQLQEEVMLIRMVPVSNVFNRFPRLVRDLAQKAGKEVQLVIQGQDTELDRSVIEEINDPLIHLLRNSVDHGIESPRDRTAAGKPASGTVKLTARHEQGRIILTVEDDGQGIDPEKLKASAIHKGLLTEDEARSLSHEKAIDLIFLSGLSTAKKITDISGRGVGMDIVRNNIERINGSVVVQTTLGVGTQFQIVLPLTLAIVPTLLVRVQKTSFAIPLVMVTEIRQVARKEIQTVNKRPVILLRDQVLPILGLSSVFGIHQEGDNNRKNVYVVVVSSNKVKIGLMVDSLIGEEEVVVKSLGSLIGEVAGISSAAILGDGQVALIVDVPGLFKLAAAH